MPLTVQHPGEPDIEWLSRDSCSSYCEQRRDTLKKDEEALELVRDELMRTQKEAIIQGLCKLNKDVKKLSVREFNSMFGCDIIDLIKKQMTAGDVNANSGVKRFRAPANAQTASGNGVSFKTPAAHKAGKLPTTMRAARRGEVAYSANGSPIDAFDHGEVVVTAKKRRGDKADDNKGTAKAPFPISIGIGAGNGETINLADPNQRNNLDGEQKAQAMQQLKAIQEQMNELMADF